jgi:hypothetical membrane protein
MARTPQTPRPPRTTQSSARLAFLVGGGAWILTAVYFVGQGIAQAAWTTPYSLIDNRVSDLGSTSCGTTLANTYICSPLHAVMNSTFVLTGVLILAGLFLTWSVWPRRRLATWGLVLLGVAGAGTILIGLSPENVNVFVHLVGALNIPAGNVAMILLGLAIWRDRREMAWFSLLAGVVGLLGMLAGPFLVILTGHGGGLAERIALYPLIIWLIVFGLSVVADRVRRRSGEVLPQAEMTSRASAAGM